MLLSKLTLGRVREHPAAGALTGTVRPRKLSAMSSTLHAAHLDPEVLLLRAGAKQIIKKEGVPLADVDALVAHADEWGMAVHVARDREYGLGARDSMDRAGRGYVTVLLARDAGVLPRARALLDAESDLRAPASAQRDAMRGFGELLGYPTCCVAAYLAGPSSPAFARGTTGFYLDAYHRTAGPFDPHLNRFALDRALVSHAPCTYRCEPSVDLARTALAEMTALDPRRGNRALDRIGRPVLWWSQERHVILGGARWEGGWLHYTEFEASPGADPSSPAVLRAFEHAQSLLEEGTALCYALGSGFVIRARTGALIEVGDLAPLDPPFLFDFGGSWWPYERVVRPILVLDPPTSSRQMSRAATLAGDLLRVGLPTTIAHSGRRPDRETASPEPVYIQASQILDGAGRRAALRNVFSAIRASASSGDPALPPVTAELLADLADSSAPFAPAIPLDDPKASPTSWHLATELATHPARVARDLASHIAYLRSSLPSIERFVIDPHTSSLHAATWIAELAQELSRRGLSRLHLALDLPPEERAAASAALRPLRALLSRRRIDLHHPDSPD